MGGDDFVLDALRVESDGFLHSVALVEVELLDDELVFFIPTDFQIWLKLELLSKIRGDVVSQSHLEI